MDETKTIWTSKTIWANVIALAASLLVFFNVEATPAEIASITGAVGSVLGIIGRYVAVQKLTVK